MEKQLYANREWIDSSWEKLERKLYNNSKVSKDKIPLTTVNGVHDDFSSPEGISRWTNGFWPGIMWLMYDATGKDSYREAAELCEEKLDGALENFNVLHHDVGFMWHLSAGANYLLTGNEKSKNRNLHAAAVLASRYNAAGKFIKSWNGSGCAGWVIIDSMMNIPLLYWAAEQSNNIAFKQMAMDHADMCMQNHIRPDGSVYHVIGYDPLTGACKGVAAHTQGYEHVGSSWARGQAWAIYGFAISYLRTGEQRYLDTAKKVAHYFLAAVAATGYVPMEDLRSPEEPVYYDTSAGAIAACGLIEIAKAVPEFEKKMYMDGALKLTKALVDGHCDWTLEEQSVLQNCSTFYGRDVNQPYIYGEYFLVEALYKLKGFDRMFW